MIFWDTETYPIRPGRQAPRIVCVQTSTGGLELREPGLDRIEAGLSGGESFCGHSVSYDVLCAIAARPSLLEPFFWAYAEDRVACTKVREALIRNAQGTLKSANLSLLGVVNRYELDHAFDEGVKGSGVRTGYAQWDGVPVDQWPSEYQRYALADLIVGDVYKAQENRARSRGWLEDEHRQARADFVLWLMSAWGMRTNPDAVHAFARLVDSEHEDIKALLQREGLVRPDGSRNTKAAKSLMESVSNKKNLPVPVTKKGQTSLAADHCQATGNDLLVKYARYTSIDSLRARYRRLIHAGTIPIQPSFNVMVDSGRTSCRAGNGVTAYGDQTQNPHRAPGVRECYRAREGFVLCSVDWASAELHTLAQVCLNMGLESELAKVLNAGLDAHLNFACEMNSWGYEWALANKKNKIVKDARQGAKAANFGFPGGLGTETFRVYAAATYGMEITDERAKNLKAWWLRLYPEMRGYFAYINEIVSAPTPTVVHHGSHRYRGRVTYCSGANSYFQGLASDMAKHAGFALAWECYTGKVVGEEKPSVLGGSRLWNFVHDEWILEVPEQRAHECAKRIVEIMEDAGRKWCPDVPVRAEPALCRTWRKGAEPTLREGVLVPWEDRDLSAVDSEKIRRGLDLGGDPHYLSWKHGIELERVLQQ